MKIEVNEANFLQAIIDAAISYRNLYTKSLKLAATRAQLEPGSSRARVTTANARWARVAEAKDEAREALIGAISDWQVY